MIIEWIEREPQKNNNKWVKIKGRVLIGCFNGISFTLYPWKNTQKINGKKRDSGRWYHIETETQNKKAIREFIKEWAEQNDFDIDGWAKNKSRKLSYVMSYAEYEASNPSVIRRDRHKISDKGRRMMNSTVSREYTDYSGLIYARKLENGKIMRNEPDLNMGYNRGVYLDGTCPENSQHIYRNLEPVFPVKSGKRK